MFLTPAMYIDVVQSWPWDELLHEPGPCRDSRNQYPGRAPVTLIDAVHRSAAADGVKPDDVLEEALQLRLQRSDG
jgi:hypothetical protein